MSGFNGYDQWKTASPYDNDELASDFEIEHTIAEKNTLCPACGYHGNISTARWTVEVEKAGFPNDLLHDELTFAGWNCEECDWTQEAIESDYERLREYKKSFQPRIDAVNRAIATQRKPAMTIDEFFQDLPDEDFQWDDTGDNDWHVYCCGERDCPQQWHKHCPTIDIGRENGKRYVDIGSTDQDGNHDLDISYDERPPYNDTKPEEFHDVGLTIANQMDDYFRGWAEYWIDCAHTGIDPLNQCTKTIQPGNDWIEFCIKAAERSISYTSK